MAMIEVEELVPLARGGTAELFVGRAGGVRVVVKCARDDRAGASGALAAEADVLAQLAPLALAPRLHGRTQVRGREALVIEHIALPTLRTVRGAPAARAVCAAVARMHDAGIVHADLTPDNVLIDADAGLVRLIDFGTAARIGSPLAPLATVGYAAPERHAAACAATAAVDVYALGVICYELLVGAAPFDGTIGELRVAHAAHRVPRVSAQVKVSERVDAVIAAAMAKAPEARPTARDMVEAFAETAAAAAAVSAAAPAPAAASAAAAVVEPVTAASARGEPAVLVGFAWTAGAAMIRDRVAAAGGVLAFSEADRHVAALWRGDARGAADRLAEQLRTAGAEDVDVVETRVQIGATGVPRGATIIQLGRRPRTPVPLAKPVPAPFVGRDALLGAVREALIQARRGSALITVYGAPGFGKSRLARAVIESLQGFAVVELRAATLAQALDALALTASETGEVDRAALAVLAGRMAMAGSAAEPLAAAPGALRQAAARALADRLPIGRPRAILLDDAHAADPIVLDALELATLDARGQLAVIALARPALAATRPRWGQRAAHGLALHLAPLARDDGRALIRALLPVTAAVPSAALDRLIERCGGVPLYLTELVGALQRVDRARGATTTATRGALPTDLVELPAELGIVAWAVADELAGLSPGAVAAAEALALRGETQLAEVAPMFAALDAAGVHVELDPGVAIADLRRTGALVEHGGALRFRHDLVREAIAARCIPATAAAIHRALIGLARTPADRARHAEGAGDRATAAIAWRASARDAQLRHDELAAETALTRALGCLDAPSAQLLRQRGGARARLGRHDAAAADFAAARELARAAGDRAAAIDVLLDEATALDWSLHHAASAACVAEARALAAPDEPALRRARLAMATGRAAWRAGDAAGAIAPCREAIALADPLGADGYETAIACRLMLGFVLGGRGDIAAAAAILDEAEALAAARGDLMHVAAARCNRYPVHAARGDAAGLRADLAAFAAAGRELGVAVTEYRGALYLALAELWCGDDDRAERHARAALVLERADPTLFPRPCAALVLAQLAARRGNAELARACCEDARAHGGGNALDRVRCDAVLAWLAGELRLAEATALADRAIALGESEAAFEILELAARAAGLRHDTDTEAAAHHAARTRPPNLPRFIPGLLP